MKSRKPMGKWFLKVSSFSNASVFGQNSNFFDKNLIMVGHLNYQSYAKGIEVLP